MPTPAGSHLREAGLHAAAAAIQQPQAAAVLLARGGIHFLLFFFLLPAAAALAWAASLAACSFSTCRQVANAGR